MAKELRLVNVREFRLKLKEYLELSEDIGITCNGKVIKVLSSQSVHSVHNNGVHNVEGVHNTDVATDPKKLAMVREVLRKAENGSKKLPSPISAEEVVIGGPIKKKLVWDGISRVELSYDELVKRKGSSFATMEWGKSE
jgi:hypothetical protein